MIDVILYEPEIPQNTGAIIRLCANSGASLHLIHPLGFVMEDARLRRAGLDYREYAIVREYHKLDECLASLSASRVFALTATADRAYSDVTFRPGDAAIFGPESSGLPSSVLRHSCRPTALRIPMREGSRSLNLANAVSIVVYAAWRDMGFSGAAGPRSD
jgi:tRNA (cytidine/uridine-2'-O-)-methyltransferase